MTKSKPLIFIIAGEASGDQLGVDLMSSLKSIGDFQFAGIGGEGMAKQGLESIFPMEELSIMGLWGIVKDLPNLLGRLSFTVEKIKELKPDVVITIDAPEFSLRVMKRVHKLKERPKLIHYVAPTVWAYSPKRAQKISKFLDHLFCLYPFEPPYFEEYGLQTTFVGHPIAKKDNILEKVRDENLLCVLPGSRRSEIKRLLPIFKETVTVLQSELPDLKVIIPTTEKWNQLVTEGTKDWPVDVEIVIGDQKREQAFQKATAALSKSGTVALQLAAARLPFVIAYKVNKFDEWIARYVFTLTTPWACMVNILMAFKTFGPKFRLTREVDKLVPNPWIPEFIQENCTPQKLAPAVLKLLQDKRMRTKQIKTMGEVMNFLSAQTGVAAKALTQGMSKS
jgi:lipid-A-disaccharide synthase